ncbi:hypothetical protein F5Y16DRAFT_404373 [Xylariaceae sp. FL0255]|nr:hypothetical protein F5Y16DRAFT_404373 [Xylariaceae sp. FL0255]
MADNKNPKSKAAAMSSSSASTNDTKKGGWAVDEEIKLLFTIISVSNPDLFVTTGWQNVFDKASPVLAEGRTVSSIKQHYNLMRKSFLENAPASFLQANGETEATTPKSAKATKKRQRDEPTAADGTNDMGGDASVEANEPPVKKPRKARAKKNSAVAPEEVYDGNNVDENKGEA